MINKENYTILQNIGYFHPSQANWNYDIYQLHIKGGSRIYFKVAFQSPNQVIDTLKDRYNIQDITFIPSLYLPSGTPSLRIKGIPDILDLTIN